MKIMNAVYEVFKDYYSKYFNEAPNKPNKYLNYKVLKTMLKRQKISFGLRMYSVNGTPLSDNDVNIDIPELKNALDNMQV